MGITGATAGILLYYTKVTGGGGPVEFEKWFRERTSGFERLLLGAALVLLVLLFAAQALLAVPGARRLLSLADRLEGEPLAPARETFKEIEAGEPEAFLELALDGEVVPGSVRVLVNGRPVSSFGVDGRVTIAVRAGDLVEVDGDVPEREIRVIVSAASARVHSPAPGKNVYFFGRPETVGWVVME